MYSILHISDLHRSKDEPIDNRSLLASLVADRDRYVLETPRIPPPDAVIVSGDLIEGASIGAEDWEESLKTQHEVAYSFLTGLCKHSCKTAEASRMLLTPGNHDVCWKASLRAMGSVANNQSPSDVSCLLSFSQTPHTDGRGLSENCLGVTNEAVSLNSEWIAIRNLLVRLSTMESIPEAFRLSELVGSDWANCVNYELLRRGILDSIGAGRLLLAMPAQSSAVQWVRAAMELRDARHAYNLKIVRLGITVFKVPRCDLTT